MRNFVILSGCSGGGKSTLLAELGRRGHLIVEEPGRRIVAEALAGDGATLPWVDMAAFARRAIEMALADRKAMCAQTGLVFFDRGLLDAIAGLAHATGNATLPREALTCRFNRQVFMTPPWPAIYRNDPERRHGLEDGIAEYERLMAFYPRLGYSPVVLPKTDVAARADFVLTALGA
ncbi:AAA family ATPase [Martelella endophytica]|uniref:ATPase n=1 Tax=Martelella endophytica TaxID=1486262 RepID=A0A0D5LNE9_MAREN|nr:AAA family ATPase [Martelella endophytica]AJY45307.1 ATPase [Martelella endophytica]